jgi:dTDP-D-glucose 4,6-dehydratase
LNSEDFLVNSNTFFDIFKEIDSKPRTEIYYSSFVVSQRDPEWKQDVSFEESLNKTVNWYIANGAWVKNIQSGEYLKWIEKNYVKR